LKKGDILRRIGRKGIIIYGYVAGWGMSLILFYIWICAWLNDDSVLVTINNHGEALVELFLFPVVILWITVGMILYFKELKRK